MALIELKAQLAKTESQSSENLKRQMTIEATSKSQLEALKTAHQGAMQHATATNAARISELEAALRVANDKAFSLESDVQKQTAKLIAVAAKYVDSCCFPFLLCTYPTTFTLSSCY